MAAPAITPAIPSSHLEVARNLLLAGKNREASEEYQKAYEAGEIDANAADAWRDWGVALFRAENRNEAIEKLETARRINPRWASPYINLGAVFAASKNFDLAIENYRKAADLDPTSATNYVNWGHSLFKQRRYPEAVEQYTKATNIERENSDAWLWKIKALRNLQLFEEAESAGREALQALPGRSDILQELAGVYFDQANYRRGVEIIDKAIQLERQDPRRNRELWKAKLAALRDATVSALVEETVAGIEREFPDDPGMLIEAAHCRKDRGQFEEAFRLLDRALDLRENAAALVEKGWVWVDWGCMDHAIGQFDRALELDPYNLDAVHWKIYSLRQRRRQDEAEKLLDRFLAAGSPLAGELLLLNDRAWLCLDRSRFEEGIEAFRGTLQTDPNNTDARVGILTAHRLRRDFKSADRFWNEEIAGSGMKQDSSLFAERCQFFLDQRQYDAGIEYCRQRPATDRDALEREGIFLRSLRRFDEAQKKMEAALARFAKNLAFMSQLAASDFDCKRYRQAALSYQLMLEIRPNHEGALIGKANSLYVQGPDQFDAAERAILEALDRIPENASLYMILGQIYYDRGQFKEAEEYLSKAIAFSPPDYVAADFLRLGVLEQLKRGDEAGLAAAALVSVRPNDLEVRNQMGWFYLGRNDVVSARREFEFIYRIDPKHSSGINGLGGVFFEQGDFRKAEESFRAASELDPGEPVFLTNLAWAMVRQAVPGVPASRRPSKWRELMNVVWERDNPASEKEEFSEPEESCRAALALDPRAIQAYTCLGAIAFRRGHMLESEDYLRTSIRMSARSGGYVDLGALYVHMGRYDEAETILKKAVETSRADSSARIELGNLYLQTGRENEGMRLFRGAADINPADPEPPRALALALKGQGDFREAEQVLRKAIQKLDKPRRWQLHLTLGQLLTELGEKSEDRTLLEDALKEITTAIPLKPLNPDAYFRAGIIQHRLAEYSRAARHFRECLRLDPDHIDAARNLRIVQDLMREQLRRGRSAFWLGLTLGVFCLIATVAMWYLYLLKDSKITSGMIVGLTPTFIAVAAAAFLFPYLVKVKLPGVEAELSQPVENISKGPMGGIGK